MADDKMTRIRADLVERAGEVRDKLNEEATGPWRVTQKAILEDAIRIGLDAIEQRPPVEPPALDSGKQHGSVAEVAPVASPPVKAPSPSPPVTSEPDDAAPASAYVRAYRRPSKRSKPATRAGRLLRQWREGSGLTQAQAAERVGKSQPTWGRFERGDLTPPADVRAVLEDLVEDLYPEDWTTPNTAAGEEG